MGAEPAGGGAEYFMIRIHSNPDQDPPAIAGAIEHLGTGEKRTFVSGEELLRLLGSWPERSSKLPPGSGGSNQSPGRADRDVVV